MQLMFYFIEEKRINDFLCKLFIIFDTYDIYHYGMVLISPSQ